MLLQKIHEENKHDIHHIPLRKQIGVDNDVFRVIILMLAEKNECKPAYNRQHYELKNIKVFKNELDKLHAEKLIVT